MGSPLAFRDAAGKVTKAIHPASDVKHFDDDPDGRYAFHHVGFFGCWSGDFAVVLRHDGECDGGGSCDKPTQEPFLDFYTGGGKLLWTKKMLPTGDTYNLIVAKNDRRILYAARTPAIVAITAEGKEEVFPFPRNAAFSGLGLSPNGRFAWANVSHLNEPGGKSYIRFYDLDKGLTHDFPTFVGNGHCSDDGAAEVREYPNPGTADVKIVHRYKFND